MSSDDTSAPLAYPLSSAHGASKGGVAQTTKVMAPEWRQRGVRVNGIGLPREPIGAAIFLASDASELVTGNTIMCDDGYFTA